MTEANHVALLAAVSGKTLARAREVLAEWFPRPDVPATIRKLPERPRAAHRDTSVAPLNASPLFEARSTAGLETPHATAAPGEAATPPEPARATPSAELTMPARASAPPLPPAPSPVPLARRVGLPSPIEPLSPGRFKVSFTADTELKQKIELARDLLRHALPQGDLASIVGRALDALIEKTERRAASPKPASPTMNAARRKTPTQAPSAPPRPAQTQLAKPATRRHHASQPQRRARPAKPSRPAKPARCAKRLRPAKRPRTRALAERVAVTYRTRSAAP